MLQRDDTAAVTRRSTFIRREIPERRDHTNIDLQIRSMPFGTTLIADAGLQDFHQAATSSRRTGTRAGLENRIASSIEPNLSASTSRA
jgi:hypothetical protein